jgi:uncharacterized membrane protein
MKSEDIRRDNMIIGVLAFVIGFTVGLRSFAAPAAISMAARWGGLNLSNTGLAFLGYTWTPWLLTGAAIGELINDKLPNTPSRKTPFQFAFRILSGAISGASIGATSGSPLTGMLAGILGAITGTLGGSTVRAKLAKLFGRDLWAALCEDVVTVLLVIMVLLRIA